MSNKLICQECGAIFSEDEAGSRSECVGEFWGTPAYMSFMECPECGSDCIDDYKETDEEDEEGDEE